MMYSSRSALNLFGVNPNVPSLFLALIPLCNSRLETFWERILPDFPVTQQMDWPQSWWTKEKLVPAERLPFPAVVLSTLIFRYRSLVAICINRHLNHRNQPHEYTEIKLKCSIWTIPWGFIWLFMNPRRQLSSRKRKRNKKPSSFKSSRPSQAPFVMSSLNEATDFQRLCQSFGRPCRCLKKFGRIYISSRHVLSYELFHEKKIFSGLLFANIFNYTCLNNSELRLQKLFILPKLCAKKPKSSFYQKSDVAEHVCSIRHENTFWHVNPICISSEFHASMPPFRDCRNKSY